MTEYLTVGIEYDRSIHGREALLRFCKVTRIGDDQYRLEEEPLGCSFERDNWFPADKREDLPNYRDVVKAETLGISARSEYESIALTIPDFPETFTRLRFNRVINRGNYRRFEFGWPWAWGMAEDSRLRSDLNEKIASVGGHCQLTFGFLTVFLPVESDYGPDSDVMKWFEVTQAHIDRYSGAISALQLTDEEHSALEMAYQVEFVGLRYRHTEISIGPSIYEFWDRVERGAGAAELRTWADPDGASRDNAAAFRGDIKSLVSQARSLSDAVSPPQSVRSGFNVRLLLVTTVLLAAILTFLFT